MQTLRARGRPERQGQSPGGSRGQHSAAGWLRSLSGAVGLVDRHDLGCRDIDEGRFEVLSTRADVTAYLDEIEANEMASLPTAG